VKCKEEISFYLVEEGRGDGYVRKKISFHSYAMKNNFED